jgi:glycosyltransferase involved in cell wall biosynthesis
MKGKGFEYLEWNFKQLESQIFTDFDVVIADHSINDDLKVLCEMWNHKFRIHYLRNEEYRGSAAYNTDFAIRHSTGKYIKILCQDDYLYDAFSLDHIISAFDESTMWMASAYMHTRDRLRFSQYHCPYVNPKIYTCNTIGTPSCIALRNSSDIPEIDKTIKYAYDCDWYHRMIQSAYGIPKIINSVNIVNYLWGGSITSEMSEKQISDELEKVRRKYEGTS